MISAVTTNAVMEALTVKPGNTLAGCERGRIMSRLPAGRWRQTPPLAEEFLHGVVP